MKINKFSFALLDSLVVKTKISPKLRQHQNIHESYQDPCQRIFNAIDMKSYIRPHRHLLDHKKECLIALCGIMALIVFNDTGQVVETIRFGTEKHKNEALNIGVELPPMAWHTVIPLIPGSILFEVKEGPFDPTLAKEWAPWAPEEMTTESEIFLTRLHELIENNSF